MKNKVDNSGHAAHKATDCQDFPTNIWDLAENRRLCRCHRKHKGLGVEDRRLAISANLTARHGPKPAKRALSCSPRRASRGSVKPAKCILSPVGGDIRSNGCLTPPLRGSNGYLPAFPRLARLGLQDVAATRLWIARTLRLAG